MKREMGPAEWSLLLGLSAVWGGSFFFVEVALEDLPPLTVVLARVGLAAIALNTFILLRGERLPGSRRAWGAFLAMGALNNMIPFTLIAWSQTRIDSGLAAILNATTPLFTVLLAHWLTRDEPATAHRFAGVTVGFAGVAVLIGPAALVGSGGTALAQMAVLAAALSYGFAGIFGRRFAGLSAPVAAAGMLTASAVLMAPLALVLERPWTLAPGATTLAALAGLALVSTAFAYLLYFRLLAAAGATNLLLVTFLIPVSALALGILFLGEQPDAFAFAGMGLIGAGLVLIDGRLLRRPA